MEKWEFCLASQGIFFFQNFFSEMRSGLKGFSGPSITGWTYSITGFTLVLTGRVSVCNPFLWAKVLQNPPVLPACRLPRCRFRLPCCPAAFACAALPLEALPPALYRLRCLPSYGLPCCRYPAACPAVMLSRLLTLLLHPAGFRFAICAVSAAFAMACKPKKSIHQHSPTKPTKKP